MNAISLFSNVGIGEIYLKDININVVAACEINKQRSEMYKSIYPEVKYVLNNDIKNTETKEKICEIIQNEHIELLMATPPCQGMSNAGMGGNWHDERNLLVLDTVDIILKSLPNYVFIENVPTFLKTKIKVDDVVITIEEYILNSLGNDYHIQMKVVNAADFGVPQFRKRTIVAMVRRTIKKDIFLIEKTTNKWATVRDAIGNLPLIYPLEKENFSGDNRKKFKYHKYHYPPIHCRRHIFFMEHTPEGNSAFDNEDKYIPRKQNGDIIKGFATTYKRMSWDEPAPTITMMNGAISSQNNVHPGLPKEEDCIFDSPRVLTILEIMRLSSIPDDWEFPSKYSDHFIRSVIGEGVPPLMVKKILERMIYDGEA
jgi:DNA (cytosine-5)-methyltransferase 1